MGLGIIEPKPQGVHVPGTSLLFEDQSHTSEDTRNHEIVLVPQPSNSPRDPLNWPSWKKDLTLFCICINAAFAGILGPALSSITAILVKEFDKSFTDIEIFSGYPLFTSGIGALLASVSSRLWGKRPAYLVCSALTFSSTLWSAKVTSYSSFLGARLVQGFGLGAFEGIVLSTIGDMYFVHQRGRRVSFLAMMSLSTTYFSPIIGGYITDRYGWRMQFWILTGFTAFGLLVLILFCPETAYQRALILETDAITPEDAAVAGAESSPNLSGTMMDHSKKRVNEIEHVSIEPSDELPRNWIEEMAPFRGRFSQENPFILLARPFVCMVYPAVLWAFSFGGVFTAWMIGSAIILAQLFAPPPASYTPTKLGYLYTFPTVGAICSFILSHLIMDWSSKWLARRNNGVYEPEFRLILVLPTLIIGIPGLVAFGFYADTSNSHKHELSWVVISLLFGMIAFAAVSSLSCSFSYLLDAHRDISVETTVALVLIRNFFVFGASFFLGPWLTLSGSKNTYGAMAGIQSAFILLSVLMYMFGKVIRNFMHRHSPLDFCHVQLRRANNF